MPVAAARTRLFQVEAYAWIFLLRGKLSCCGYFGR